MIRDIIIGVAGIVIGYVGSYFINRNNANVADDVNKVIDKVVKK